MIRIRLTLKEPYYWGQPDNLCEGQVTFVKSLAATGIGIGNEVCFRELYPFSESGDLNDDHYKYYDGRRFVAVEKEYPDARYDIELKEM